MPSFKALILGSALFVQCLYTATAVPRQRSDQQKQQQQYIDQEAQADNQAFQKLLDQVDPTALHSALHRHSPTPFRDGIFNEDRTAAEALHRADPPLATSIVALAKRQAPGNSSTVVVITSVNTVTAVDTTITEPVTVTTVTPTVPSTVPATQSSASPAPPSSSNTVVSPSPSPSTPIVVGPSSTPPGGTIVVGGTTTVGGNTVTAPGGPIITSAPDTTTSASGQVITTTNAQGVTIVSTVGGGFVTLSRSSGDVPGGSISGTAIASRSDAAGSGSETSVVLRTTNLPNGGQSTITEYTIVKGSATGIATPSGTAGVAGGSETSTGAPSLQTNLSPRSRSLGWEVVGALGGAVGFAMML